MTEHEQLAELCARLGAPRAQATILAAQLLKRAEQLAQQRGTTREAALARLLDFVAQGRAGEVPKEFAPPSREIPGEPGAENTQRRD